MIHIQALLMTASAASVDSPSVYVLAPYAGHDSHVVLWAFWPCHRICRWVLPPHHHSQ